MAGVYGELGVSGEEGFAKRFSDLEPENENMLRTDEQGPLT